MAKNDYKEIITNSDFKKKVCSICNKEILPGRAFIRDIISNKIYCSDCDDCQAPIKGDNLISID